MRAAGVWLEVTTVVMPGVNDDAVGLKEMATFIAGVGLGNAWASMRA